jgi:hypothetical protein
MERALKAGKAKNKDEKKDAASKERSALMQRSFEARADRLSQKKIKRQEQ